MNIRIEHIRIEFEDVQDLQPLTHKSQIVEGTKLYYEINYRKGRSYYKTGKFKEVQDPMDLKINDNRLDDPDYITHHNFLFK